MRAWIACVCLLLACCRDVAGASPELAAANASTFEMDGDRFLLDGKPWQIISGSMHFFRIHPSYWRDRLERAAAMGINTVEVYTPWQLHEPDPGHYVWSGLADVERWLEMVQEMGMKVLLRPGPYICAEWDNGGFPHWFASSKVAGGRSMRTRTRDPAYLDHVERWFSTLFARLRRFMLENGGPILMVQIENEYGFCGDDKAYLRSLASIVRTHLSSKVLLFTTDPPGVAPRGTLAGDEVYTVVDFGPGWFDPNYAFGVQKSLNAPGKSPPFCSEFYTGWLTHWGELMANTSTDILLKDTQVLLEYANSTASLSFYMVHGGTNFGFWAGANVDGNRYLPHITSYDYDAPISEAGDYCQPGIGGQCKFHALRDLIARHTGRELPPVPPRPAIANYGRVALGESLPLLEAARQMYGPLGGVRSQQPDIMEEYGQRWGLILYRTRLPAAALHAGGTLDLGAPVHDYASVLVDGRLAGRLDRSQLGGSRLQVAPHQPVCGDCDTVQLDILVEAMGRQNFGCDTGNWDFKGLISKNVTFNGNALLGWEVFPLQLDDPSGLDFAQGTTGAALLAAVRRRLLAEPVPKPPRAEPDAGPVFFRGNFSVPESAIGANGFPADTYLATHGWSKGVAWVNGFNLGWFWPSVGPQMTLYIPGPVLRPGDNELVLLEVERPPLEAAVTLSDEPDFHGPNPAASMVVQADRVEAGQRRSAHLPPSQADSR